MKTLFFVLNNLRMCSNIIPNTRRMSFDVVTLFLSLTLAACSTKFGTTIQCFSFQLWTSVCQLGKHWNYILKKIKVNKKERKSRNWKRHKKLVFYMAYIFPFTGWNQVGAWPGYPQTSGVLNTLLKGSIFAPVFLNFVD